jgi:bifunctional DNA-binding transcriptional regulator/antitoxin component of YhaV-PrlF toxin-antitoxin module
MPLNEKVEFKARLQRCNQVLIPKLIRTRFKLEPLQILKATLCCPSIWDSSEQ